MNKAFLHFPRWPFYRQIPVYALLAVAGAVLYAIAEGDAPHKHFKEHERMTEVSGGLLTLTGVVALGVFVLRCRQTRRWVGAHWLWFVLAVGFVWLAFDDVWMIHELLEKRLYKIWSIEKTRLTSHLDDAILAGYGLVGVVALWVGRAEMRRYRRIWPMLAGACILAVCYVPMDWLCHRSLLREFIHDDRTHEIVYSWIYVCEDGLLKMGAEGFFLGAFVQALGLAWRGPSWKSPALRLSAKGATLGSAILEEREDESKPPPDAQD